MLCHVITVHLMSPVCAFGASSKLGVKGGCGLCSPAKRALDAQLGTPTLVNDWMRWFCAFSHADPASAFAIGRGRFYLEPVRLPVVSYSTWFVWSARSSTTWDLTSHHLLSAGFRASPILHARFAQL